MRVSIANPGEVPDPQSSKGRVGGGVRARLVRSGELTTDNSSKMPGVSKGLSGSEGRRGRRGASAADAKSMYDMREAPEIPGQGKQDQAGVTERAMDWVQ